MDTEPANPSPKPLIADNRIRLSREVVAHLQKSEIYRAYEDAFQGATGLPLAIRAVGTLQSPLLNAKNANPFFRLLAANAKTFSACQHFEQRFEKPPIPKSRTLDCFAGLSESAVPIRVGDQIVAFLETGQIFLHRPSVTLFRQSLRRLEKLGAVIDRAEFEKAFFATRIMAKPQYDSILRLLSLIAEHFSCMINRLMVQQAASELPAVARARAYIALHQTEQISLGDVAKAANMSAFYFCKTFRKVTGLTFIDYLARLRVENVKKLLLNPHKRISEAAFEVGFQSLSQFNRVFRRVTGLAPTVYRERLHAAA